jgi:hypothetical protein
MTHQYNPAAGGAKTLGQWVEAVTSMKGESDAISVPDPVEMIRATPDWQRSAFANQIWERGSARGTAKWGVPF